MRYRQFGKLDWKVSALGFGCMRLPTIGEDRGNIDDDKAIAMVRTAIDNGVNYLDTAYPYHNGESERFVGRVLKDGYRDKVRIATKMPMRAIEQHDDFERIFQEQLDKLQVDYVDFYLFHGLRKARLDILREHDGLTWAERALVDGRIKHLGFSFHDDYTVFKEIIDSSDLWTFCQVQYNYVDINNQAGRKGVQYAASKGLGVVVMEPLLGGRLVDPPEPIQKIWDSAPILRKLADWALQWVWNQPEISVVLSGMSTMQHVTENVASASNSGVDSLTSEELAIVDQVRAKYQELCPIPCTKCEYCLPCTVNLNIPRLFDTLNRGAMYNKLDEARHRYARMSVEQKASACIKCRECESKCPQSIPISEWMVHLDEILGQGLALDGVRERT